MGALILDVQHKGSISKITDIFDNISDVKQFSERLTDFASMALSYHDMPKKEAENLYTAELIDITLSRFLYFINNVKLGSNQSI